MNNIKIYLKPSGSTAELYKDFYVYQYCYNNVQLTVYVPTSILVKNADNTFLNTVATGAILTTPNGLKVPTKAYTCAFVKTLTYNGVEYAEFTQPLPREFALYAGTATLVCNVVNIDNSTPASPKILSVTTSQVVPLPIMQSAYLEEDEPLTPTEAEVLQGNINELTARLDDGEFTARAIAKYRTGYEYSLGDLVYYAEKGEYNGKAYGVFLKSLADNNATAPYNADGELSDKWQLISDFNILTELYSLKGDINNSVSLAWLYAQQAEGSASDALGYKQEADNYAQDSFDSAKESKSSAAAAAESAQEAKNTADSIAEVETDITGILDGTIVVPKATHAQTADNADYAEKAKYTPEGKVINLYLSQHQAAINNIKSNIKDIESEIPSSTTPDNPLANEAFVNSTVNNMAAFYITYNAAGDAFPNKASLVNATTYYYGGQPRTPTQNDYAIVLADESQPKGVDGNYPTTRYSYQGGSWSFQYVVNNTSLTQAQVNAINSGITKEKIAAMDAATAAKYAKPSSGIPENDLAQAVQNSLDNGDSALQEIAIGTVTTGAAGTSAKVTATTANKKTTLNFTIPRGNTGAQGATGPSGQRVNYIHFIGLNSYDYEITYMSSEGNIQVISTGSTEVIEVLNGTPIYASRMGPSVTVTDVEMETIFQNVNPNEWSVIVECNGVSPVNHLQHDVKYVKVGEKLYVQPIGYGGTPISCGIFLITVFNAVAPEFDTDIVELILP